MEAMSKAQQIFAPVADQTSTALQNFKSAANYVSENWPHSSCTYTQPQPPISQWPSRLIYHYGLFDTVFLPFAITFAMVLCLVVAVRLTVPAAHDPYLRRQRREKQTPAEEAKTGTIAVEQTSSRPEPVVVPPHVRGLRRFIQRTAWHQVFILTIIPTSTLAQNASREKDECLAGPAWPVFFTIHVGALPVALLLKGLQEGRLNWLFVKMGLMEREEEASDASAERADEGEKLAYVGDEKKEAL